MGSSEVQDCSSPKIFQSYNLPLFAAALHEVKFRQENNFGRKSRKEPEMYWIWFLTSSNRRSTKKFRSASVKVLQLFLNFCLDISDQSSATTFAWDINSLIKNSQIFLGHVYIPK